MKTKNIYLSIALTLVSLVTLYSCTPKATPQQATPVATVVPPVPPVATSTSVSATTLLQGQTVYTARCGKCHELYKPERYDAKKWSKVVDWMAPQAKLNDTEKADVLAYLQHNAKTN
jgi:cytochrome c5